MLSYRATVPVGESQKGKEIKLISWCFPLIFSPENNNLKAAEEVRVLLCGRQEEYISLLQISLVDAGKGALIHCHTTWPYPYSCQHSSFHAIFQASCTLINGVGI